MTRSLRSLLSLDSTRLRAGFLGLIALGAVACGAQQSPSSPSSPAYRQSGYAPAATAAPAPAGAAGEAMPPSTRSNDKADAVRPGEDRPGLATHWGETRHSSIRETSFFRAEPENPGALASLWYNDEQGSRAMANSEGFRRNEHAMLGLASGGVTVSLRDARGRVLPGYAAGGKTYAVGEAGERYVIVLSNHTPARFEAVVSVDGLDVIDGKPASFGKRGYLLNPSATLEIEGFRRSESEVAAFRFGSVRGSYADRKGDDRNVGVIGVALFHERGTSMWPWPNRDVDNRKDANPFPGKFATPP